MGEVYSARDTRLDRTVAIKVLPDHLSKDPSLRQRFEREARAASSLNHPHICTVHDVGTQDGVDFLVMEHLQGETLASRLGRGPLPLDETLRCAVQIADALDKAHRQGLIHRDLKPGNVMLTKTGAKLLDFGLAKSAAAAAATPMTQAATATSPLTAAGAIVGTFHYLAPEQLEGAEADTRSDIFAFGLVLYEMLTGRRAFEAKTQASLIAAILEREPPPISALAPMSPPAIERLVKTCLAKDPDQRRQTMQDVLLDLRWISEGGSAAALPAPAAGRSRRLDKAAWWIAAALLIISGLLGAAYMRAVSITPRPVRSSILPPSGATFLTVPQGPGGAGPPALSADGRQIAIVIRQKDGTELLAIRPLDASVARPLPGTEGARFPFWSADGRSVGFFADAKLKRIDAAGGPALSLCEAVTGRGGTWSRDGVIVFAPDITGPLHRVSAAGGASTPVTTFDESRDDSHRWPWFLPDGHRFLFLNRLKNTGDNLGLSSIMVGSIDGGPSRSLINVTTNVAHASGHLLFIRENTLMAQPFDEKRAELTGDAFPIADGVQFDTPYSHGVFTASQNGVLIYQEGLGDSGSKLLWRDRNGKQLGVLGDQARYNRVEISPDGRSVVVELLDSKTGDGDLWIYDIERNLKTRFTFDPGLQLSARWSPDSRQIVFASRRSGPPNLYLKPVLGTGDQQLLLESNLDKQPGSWSPDGRFIAYQVTDPNTKADLWILPLAEPRTPIPYAVSPFRERGPAFSPDGRWLAYESDESGRSEVYVAPFPQATRKWQISTNGGFLARWKPDGTELYYLEEARRLMAAEIRLSGHDVQIGKVGPLFDIRAGSPVGIYAVHPDGKRFLINSAIQDEVFPPLTLVQNWKQ